MVSLEKQDSLKVDKEFIKRLFAKAGCLMTCDRGVIVILYIRNGLKVTVSNFSNQHSNFSNAILYYIVLQNSLAQKDLHMLNNSNYSKFTTFILYTVYENF